MKAIIITGKGQVALQNVPQPEKPAPGHIIIKMIVAGINAGDKFLISGNMPPGMFAQSKHNIAGVSGVGEVIALGDGVPEKYAGRLVSVYRSLVNSNEIIGTWSEYAQLPYLQCAILPHGLAPDDYAGVLVNAITAYSALQQAIKEGHKGMVITAGNSDTGKAMLGFSKHAGLPVIAIVRTEAAKNELDLLGAEQVLVQDSATFSEDFKSLATELNTTAIFDGVGGTLLSCLIPVLPNGSTIYAYGFLGGPAPVSFHTSMLTRGIALKGFSNFKTETVQDPMQLGEALDEISKVLHLPYFKFNKGQIFSLKEIEEALAYTGANGTKAILNFR